MTHQDICPACEDTYDNTASQLRPIWSDRHDDIVCVTCAESIDNNPTPAFGIVRPQQQGDLQ